jgi:hypothetical protein
MDLHLALRTPAANNANSTHSWRTEIHGKRAAIHPAADTQNHSVGMASLAGIVKNVSTSTETLLAFSRKYLQKVLLYGSQVRHPAWMDDLPAHERALAKSIKRLIQAPEAEYYPALKPGKTTPLLAALQLAATMHGMAPYPNRTRQSLPTFIEPQPAFHHRAGGLALENAIQTDTQYPRVRAEERTTIALPRHKRAIEKAAIEDRHIPNHILGVFWDKKYEHLPPHQLDEIFRHAEISQPVRNAKNAEQKHINLLCKCLELTSAALSQAAPPTAQSESDYLFYQALRSLWNIADQLDSQYGKNRIAQYKMQLQQKKWQHRKTGNTSRTYDDKEQTIADYINVYYPEWSKHGIDSKEKIVIYSDAASKDFTLAQILNQEHMAWLRQQAFSWRFLSDTSGLPDQQLMLFLQTENIARFQAFTQSQLSVHSPREYRELALNQLSTHLQKLRELEQTPLYFFRHEFIQRIIDELLESLVNMPVQKNDKKNMVISLTNLALAQPRHLVQEQAILAFAHSLLSIWTSAQFKDFNFSKILAADYIYRYQDQTGRYEFDTTTMVEFLCINTDLPNIAIAQRKNIDISWPQEFNQKQIAHLEKIIAPVTIFAKKLQMAHALAQIRQDLSISLPSFTTWLQRLQIDLCQKSAIDNCSLSDRFTFSYTAESLMIEIQAAQRFSFPPLEKQFSAGEILAGRQRDWESRNYNYNTKVLLQGPAKILQKKSITLVEKLTRFDTQDLLIQGLEKQKKNLLLKQHYNKYVDTLLAYWGWKTPFLHEFSQTPLMIVCRRGDNGAPGSIHRTSYLFRRQPPTSLIGPADPILVLSLISGNVLLFSSLGHLSHKLEEDENLRNYFRSHFPVDFGDSFEKPSLILRSLKQDPFERLIEWQIENFDKLVKSQAEASSFETLERLSAMSALFALPAIVLGPASAFAFDAALSSGPKLLQAAISDTKQERDDLIKQAVTEIAIGVASEISTAFIGRFISHSIKALFKQPKIHIRARQGILDMQDPAFNNINGDISMQCRARSKRSIWETLCSFIRPSRPRLRHEATHADAILFQEPLRTTAPKPSKILPGEIQGHLDLMLKNKEIREIIKHPQEKCIDVVPLIESILKAQDNNADITYRGILIWDKLVTDGIPVPQSHFVVIYRKNNAAFVFDLTAGQFAQQGLPGLTGALALPEDAWIAKYAAAGKDKVIKYKDFRNWLTAQNSFSGISAWFEASQPIEGAVLLNVPAANHKSITRYIDALEPA